jgi:hypothetical protein
MGIWRLGNGGRWIRGDGTVGSHGGEEEKEMNKSTKKREIFGFLNLIKHFGVGRAVDRLLVEDLGAGDESMARGKGKRLLHR